MIYKYEKSKYSGKYQISVFITIYKIKIKKTI